MMQCKIYKYAVIASPLRIIKPLQCFKSTLYTVVPITKIPSAEDGTSTDPCSNVYHGAEAASEPETKAHQKEANRLAPNLVAWLTVHTAAQMWIFPYGHK